MIIFAKILIITLIYILFMEEKLKMNDKVLYWDGETTMDLSEVVLVDKEHSQVKLSNGILLHRTPDSEGCYHRADYKEALEEREKKRRKKPQDLKLTSISYAWKYGEGNTEKIWKAYLFRKSFSNMYDKLKYKITLSISVTDIINDPESLDFLDKVERKISKLV